jgi:hypothetical protein
MNMSAYKTNLSLPVDGIRNYCAAQPIRRLSLFGSVLRGDFTPTSDVDVLVEFQPDAHLTYFDLYYIQQALQEIIGRQVDLLTPGAISDYFRDEVLAQAEVIYERDE